MSRYFVTLADNCSRAHESVVGRVKALCTNPDAVEFVKTEFCDSKAVNELFQGRHFYGVIHFAGFKAVGESMDDPMLYYNNNLRSTLNLVDAMRVRS